MNKAQLIEAITDRVGDRKAATEAVEAMTGAITRAVARGERVAISGFGVFEKVDRAARTARNPSTGGTVQVPATSVPRFRAGQALKDAVGGRPSGRATPAPAPAPAKAPAPAPAPVEVETPKAKGKKDADKKSKKSDDKPKSKAKKGKGK